MKAPNFASKAFIFLAANISCAVINFLAAILLARYVGVKEYGEIALFITYTGIFTALIGLSLEGSVSVAYFRKPTNEFRDHVISVIAIICVLLMTALIVITIIEEQLENLVGLPTKWLLLGAICAAMQSIINIKLTLWMAEGNAVSYAIFQVGQTSIFTIVTFILIGSTNLGWHSRLWAMLISTLCYFSLGLYSLISAKQCLGSISLREIRNALSFGVPLIPHVSGAILFTSADRFIVNALLGPAVTGLYQLAAQVGSIVMMTADSINKTFSPWLYKNLSEANSEFKRRVVKLTYIYFVAAITLGLASYFIPFNLATIIGGQGYSDANELIPHFILAQCIGGMYFMIVNYIFYTGRTKYLSIATLVSGVIGIFFGYFFINRYGVLGGGYAFIISKFFHFILSWLISARVYPMPWNLFRR